MTIYSIAKEAGVSASTVSRVINNKPGVNPKTRKEIQALLKLRHYHPDVAARGLVRGDTRIIGILISDIRNQHYTDGAYTIERAMSRDKYHSLICNTGLDLSSIRQCIDSLASRKPEAVIMIGSSYQTEDIGGLIKEYLSDTPIAIANGYLELPNVYGVVADEKRGVENCVRYLAERGRKRIVFVNDADTASNRNKIEGYRAGITACAAMLQSPPTVMTMEQTNSREESINTTRRLLDLHEETDGIIYASDYIAAAGLTAMREMGKRIPEDIAVIGINNSAYAEISYPRLTSLDNKLESVCMSCVHIIKSLLDGEEMPHKQKIYSDIIAREST